MGQESGNTVQNCSLIIEPTTSEYTSSSQSLLISVTLHLLS